VRGQSNSPSQLGKLEPPHRRRPTQDFTMEGVHVVRAGPGVWGTEVPQWRPCRGKAPVGVWGRSPPEAEAKCEISVHF